MPDEERVARMLVQFLWRKLRNYEDYKKKQEDATWRDHVATAKEIIAALKAEAA
jgi:hypothetical protein